MIRFTRLLWLAILPFLPIQAAAQPPFIAPTFGAEAGFNLDDFMMNLLGGIESPRLNGSLQAGFGFRFGSKKVLVEQSENLFYQFRERRYLLQLGLEKRIKMIDLSDDASLQGLAFFRGGFTFGDFRGTKINPESAFLPMPGAGLALRLPDGMFRLGYQYMKLETGNVSPHRLFAGFNLIIGGE